MKKIIYIFLINFLFLTNLYALIEVDITRGNLDPLPIAVSPLHVENTSDKLENLDVKKLGINIEGISFDTMVAAHLINPSAKSISLDTLSIEYLNFEMIPILDLIGKFPA